MTIYCSNCRSSNLRCVETGISVASRFQKEKETATFSGDAYICKECGTVTITGVAEGLKDVLKKELKKWI